MEYKIVAVVDQFSLSKLLGYNGIYKIRELTTDEYSLFWSKAVISDLSHFVSCHGILNKLDECGAKYAGDVRHLGLLEHEQAFVIFTENWRGDFRNLEIKAVFTPGQSPGQVELALLALVRPRGAGY